MYKGGGKVADLIILKIRISIIFSIIGHPEVEMYKGTSFILTCFS